MALTRPTFDQTLSTKIEITDPVVMINKGGVTTRDLGFLIDRSYLTQSNVAIIFKHSDQTLHFVTTDGGGDTNGSFTINTKVHISAGNVNADVLYTNNGIRWSGNGEIYSPASPGLNYTANTAPPASGNIEGDLWYNTTTDILYQYIGDGTASYWFDIQSPTITNNQATVFGTITANVIANSITANAITVSGNILPSANVTYNLGSSTQRFKDLFLSGTTIDLGGASIKTDATSGAIALIPQATVANPNPTGIVVSPAGTVSTVATTGGSLAANAISNASNTAVTTNTTTFANITATGNVVTANIYATGFFYSNGVAFSSSNYGNTEVAAYLVANPPAGTYSNANVAAYFLGNNAVVGTSAINLPSGNTAQRPASPVPGSMRYNTTLGRFEGYVPSGGWQNILSDQYTVEYLVVAGGGGGGSRHSGGGGAGGLLTATGFTVTPNQVYTVTIGAGGAGSTVTGSATAGLAGSDSVFASVTATGGGLGGSANGGNGGSGGGGGNNGLGGSGTAGQGYAGGKNVSPTYDYHGAGGGGAGGVGSDVTGAAGGAGGAGVASDITGTSVIYACGGGGGSFQGLGSGGPGGAGGSSSINGGAGEGTSAGSAGTSNTGTGGGGGSGGGGAYNGGSGVVIIRYLGSQRGTGGTVTTSGGYTIHRFTGTGTFTA